MQFFDVDSYLSYLTNIVNSASSFEQTTLQQLELLVKHFQNNSPGHYDLCISIYKEDFDLLGETLLSICNNSLSQGIFLSELNIAKLTPVLRKVTEIKFQTFDPFWFYPPLVKSLKKPL